MEKKICLALGDLNFETYFQNMINKLVGSIHSPEFNNAQRKITEVYNQELPDEEKKLKRQEILRDLFGSDFEFLSYQSLSALQRYRDTGISKFSFTDAATYLGIVAQRCSETNPDILIIREGLKGEEDFLSVLQEVRTKCDNVRIVVIGKDHGVDDPFISNIVAKGIYDITYGKEINSNQLIKFLFIPTPYSDAGKVAEAPSTPVTTVTPSKPKLFPFGKKMDKKEEPKPYLEDEIPETEKKIVTTQVEIQEQRVTPVIEKTAVTPPVIKSEESQSFRVDTDKPQVPTHIVQDSEDTGVLDVGEDDTTMLGTGDIFGCSPSVQFIPYNIKPVVITVRNADRRKNQQYVVYPDGTTSECVPVGTPLPIQSIPRNQIDVDFENYVDSLCNSTEVTSEAPQVQKVKLAKTIIFTSARQGVGCSTVAINVAASLALQGNKVLFFDSNFGTSATYNRLGFPMTELGFDEAITQEEDVLSVPLTKEKLLRDKPKYEQDYKALPDKLDYMKWSEQMTVNTTGIAGKIKDSLLLLASSYDYIIVDSTLIYTNAIYDEIYSFADMVYAVTIQDIYDTTITSTALKYYESMSIASKVGVVINRYANGVRLKPQIFSEEFYNTTHISTMLMDNAGFIEDYLNHSIYVTLNAGPLSARGRVRASILSVAEELA